MEFALGEFDKTKNKEAFALLMKYTNKIEKVLDGKLTWIRGEEVKISRIYISLKNVSIINEDDWIQIMKFHAEWSKKFFDVYVPLLRVRL